MYKRRSKDQWQFRDWLSSQVYKQFMIKCEGKRAIFYCTPYFKGLLEINLTEWQWNCVPGYFSHPLPPMCSCQKQSGSKSAKEIATYQGTPHTATWLVRRIKLFLRPFWWPIILECHMVRVHWIGSGQGSLLHTIPISLSLFSLSLSPHSSSTLPSRSIKAKWKKEKKKKKLLYTIK